MCPVNSQNDEKHTLNDRARDGSHGHGQPFLETNALLNFDVFGLLANEEKLCLQVRTLLTMYHHHCSTFGRDERT